MLLRPTISFFALSLMVSACGSPSEIRQQNIERWAKKDEATCKGYGFTQGTPEFRKCLVDEKRYRQIQQSNANSGSSEPEPGSYDWQLERMTESLFN